jgi:hypothetical protein
MGRCERAPRHDLSLHGSRSCSFRSSPVGRSNSLHSVCRLMARHVDLRDGSPRQVTRDNRTISGNHDVVAAGRCNIIYPAATPTLVILPPCSQRAHTASLPSATQQIAHRSTSLRVVFLDCSTPRSARAYSRAAGPPTNPMVIVCGRRSPSRTLAPNLVNYPKKKAPQKGTQECLVSAVMMSGIDG